MYDAALNVVAKQREDRQQARQQLGERVVEGPAERGHDRRPRARAGAAERVFTIICVVFRIRRRGRRRRLHLQMEGGCAFWPNARWGGSRAARFCAAGEGPPVSQLQSAYCGRAAARRVCCSQLDLVRCDVPSAREGVSRLGGKEASGRARGDAFRYPWHAGILTSGM